MLTLWTFLQKLVEEKRVTRQQEREQRWADREQEREKEREEREQKRYRISSNLNFKNSVVYLKSLVSDQKLVKTNSEKMGGILSFAFECFFQRSSRRSRSRSRRRSRSSSRSRSDRRHRRSRSRSRSRRSRRSCSRQVLLFCIDNKTECFIASNIIWKQVYIKKVHHYQETFSSLKIVCRFSCRSIFFLLLWD